MDSESILKLGRIFRSPLGGDGISFIDVLNYQYSSAVLVIFVAIIGTRQYIGKTELLCQTGVLLYECRV